MIGFARMTTLSTVCAAACALVSAVTTLVIAAQAAMAALIVTTAAAPAAMTPMNAVSAVTLPPNRPIRLPTIFWAACIAGSSACPNAAVVFSVSALRIRCWLATESDVRAKSP